MSEGNVLALQILGSVHDLLVPIFRMISDEIELYPEVRPLGAMLGEPSSDLCTPRLKEFMAIVFLPDRQFNLEAHGI